MGSWKGILRSQLAKNPLLFLVAKLQERYKTNLPFGSVMPFIVATIFENVNRRSCVVLNDVV